VCVLLLLLLLLCVGVLAQMVDYNVPGGKLNRGMAVYDVLVSIKGAEVGGGGKGGGSGGKGWRGGGGKGWVGGGG